MDTQKKVLILGAGLVVRPLVLYLSDKGYKVILASRTLERAQHVCKGITNAVAEECDVETEQGVKRLDELIPPVDAVISMLPYLLHPVAAKKSLQHGKNFLTTSYVSDAMRALEAEAKEKNLVIINECGVDPGTDHMSAMKIIDRVRAAGGCVTSFTSFCGGLPAPDNNNNPLGYKLSWAPRGVLLASRNDARFLKDGEVREIPGQVLFDNYEVELVPEQNIEYERYPNRNSLQYIDIYGLSKTKTMIRGSYRNKNWCFTVKKLVELGFLDMTEQQWNGKTFAQLVSELINSSAGAADTEGLKKDVRSFLHLTEEQEFVITSMEWLGMFDNEKAISEKVKTRLDALCKNMEERMQYGPGERDMILMRHEFIAEYPAKEDGAEAKREKIVCTLIDYGIPDGDSSMSRTVGIPIGIATRLVLEGIFTTPGLSIPIIPELYNPILDELETHNIRFVDHTEPL